MADALVDSYPAHALDGEGDVSPAGAWPFGSADFRRWDEGEDGNFYSEPSFDRHVDAAAQSALERLYAALLAGAPAGLAVLDLCASWESHLPEGLAASRVAAVGLSGPELSANRAATETHVRDLNRWPSLPFGSGEFDVATMSLSVGYLTQPREVFSELHRVLRPGGLVVITFSSKCFPSKAVALWARHLHDGFQQCRTVATYLRCSQPGGWRAMAALDVSPKRPSLLGSDPLWAVTAVRV